MESFQKRDRDRRKLEKRVVKEARRKERADKRRGIAPSEFPPLSPFGAVAPPVTPPIPSGDAA
jgi:hypothetical protein